MDQDDNNFDIDEISENYSDEDTVRTPPKKTKRSSKTSKEQFQKLPTFMESHSDFTRRKADEQLTLDWELLCSELNAMGQAKHSPKEWRKVWSDYKGKKMAKKSTSSTTTVQLENIFHSTVPIDANSSHTAEHVHSSAQCNANLEAVSSQDTVSLQDDKVLASEILKKLDRAVELYSEANNHLKDIKELINTKFNVR